MRYQHIIHRAEIHRQEYLANLVATGILWTVARLKQVLNYIKLTFSAVEQGSQDRSRLKNVCSFDH